MITEISEADKFAMLPKEDRDAILDSMSEEQLKELSGSWKWWARPKQLRCFQNDWNTFIYLCGRGFGKSRTACEWVVHKALTNPGCKIAVVGATAGIVNRTVVNGDGGIMEVYPQAHYKRGDALIKFDNGSTIFLYSADEPKRLRGPNHHFALADDVIAWRYPEAYTMLKLTVRIGTHPQTLVTTSAGATPLILGLISNNSEDEHVIEKAVEEVNENDFTQKGNLIIVRGTTFENTHLPKITLDEYTTSFPEESTVGQQELYARIVLKVDGALFDRKWIQRFNKINTIVTSEDYGKKLPETPYIQTIVAVDPAVTVNKRSDHTAIVVSSKGIDGNFYVRFAQQYKTSPGEWAKEIARVYHKYKADKVVVETNNGGLLVKETMDNVDHFYQDGRRYSVNGSELPIEFLTAKQGKYVRATPVAFLYETMKVWHVGVFAELEQQMLSFKGSPNDKDDLVDALVYSLLTLSGAKPAAPFHVAVGGKRATANLGLL